ncbi:inosine-uridine nucleoside n-ribohydrolase [Grosmannia clavigera kw1407]|uniref:Inosine-uridine nucleoside n-ribohydrolase n=1 Tax=Grosmannia clavigera (strain kw1407 / UAMH 11150) TaxID=655863 RepID=F0XEW0_GROCL|nr:inosine-uridine nucleoside n-ribohydrolase [Grosmannia clavigera kw1407]EFX03579.1 inosine-uridine nucleoside n-ribohydrolase [Grosmannia clavigera kw1407]
MWSTWAVLFLSVSSLSPASATAAHKAKAKPILFDTDIFSDVDDVGALTIANTLHRCGAADLRGIFVNTPSEYGSLTVSAINTYFGHGDIPIAALRPLTNETFVDTWEYILGEYTSKIAYNWPHDLAYANESAEPLTQYRELLAAADDASLTLVSVGFLDNLAALLDSPADAISPLNGTALIEAKVAELVIMGGEYPSGWEFNLGSSPSASQRVVNRWPRSVALTFSGASPGGNVFSAAHLAREAPADSPSLAAYQWYVGRCATRRESWDPITTLYAILGLDADASAGQRRPLFAYGNTHGYNTVDDDGNNAWVNDTAVTNQHWITLADGVTNNTVATVLDRYFASGPSTPCAAVAGSHLTGW